MVDQWSILIAILIRLAVVFFIAAAVTLFFKLVFKLKWLTVICLFVLLTSVFQVHPFFGHIVFPNWLVPYSKIIFLTYLFLDAVCVPILLSQFFRWLFTSASTQASVNPAERSRILKMVEEGKISTEEGKELLDAMGKSSALMGEEKFTRVDIAILAGVGLVVLGFFLPWVYIWMDPDLMSDPVFALDKIKPYQAGYHLGAIGWTIFIIAVASAIPVFVTPRNLLYKISMLQIFLTIIGAVLVISVLVQAGEHLGAGLVFCLLGFIVAFTASIAKLKSLAA